MLVAELTKERHSFLDQLDKKFVRLLRECPYPKEEAQLVADRLEEHGLLTNRPHPNDPPSLASLKLIGDNPKLAEIWQDVRDKDQWQAAQTAEEFVSLLLPSPESLV